MRVRVRARVRVIQNDELGSSVGIRPASHRIRVRVRKIATRGQIR